MNIDVAIFLFNLLALFPLVRIFRRTGLDAWYALLLFIPVIGMYVVLSILAFVKWRKHVHD